MGHFLPLLWPQSWLLGAGWRLAGGILRHGTSAHRVFLFAGMALAARGKWRRRRTTRTALWALPTTRASEVRLAPACGFLALRHPPEGLRPPWPCPWVPRVGSGMLAPQILPGESLLLGTLAAGSPRGAWLRIGDMGCRGLPVFWGEAFCLSCILAVRMHVDRGCGDFTPKAHSCSQGRPRLLWSVASV